MLLLVSLLAADPVAMMKVAAEHRSTLAADAEAPSRSPYRLEPEAADGTDGKAAAVRTTGARCAVTGPTLCTRKPRTIFSSSY